MDDFERELKQGFLEEAAQLIADAEQCFLALEHSPDDMTLIEKIFRLAHNLKGGSKAVGFDDLGAFTHEFESYLLTLKNGEIKVTPPAVSLLLRCNDHLMKMVQALKDDFNAKVDSEALLGDIRSAKGPGGTTQDAAPAPVAVEQPVVVEEETISLAEVQAVQAVEAAAAATAVVPEAIAPVQASQPEPVMASPAPVAAAPAPTPAPVQASAPAAAPAPAAPKPAAAADESIRVSLGRLEKLLNFVGELVIYQTVLKEQVQASKSPLLKKTVHQMSKVTKEVQDISMGLRMVPLKQTFQKMQRIVRDTSSFLKKKVTLHMAGEDTELDKTLLEKLGDPLVHLIRNAVDHGIEPGDVRLERGKPETGNVWLNAYHQSGNIVIEVKDDGFGLDPEKLKTSATKKGILKPDAVLTDKEAYNLIFAPGFSTKAIVTDVSGRGVGMDVVRTNIEELQGDIQIETELGKGTTFKIILPLTLAIIDGMIVKNEDQRYVIPLAHVHESFRPTESDVHFVTGMGEVLALRGENLPMFPLTALLGKRTASKPASESIAIVVRSGEQAFAVLVDDIVGQHEVVIKQLGQEHKNLKGFTGSAILGDGKPSLILELIDLVARYKPSTMAPPVDRKEPKDKKELNRRIAA